MPVEVATRPGIEVLKQEGLHRKPLGNEQSTETVAPDAKEFSPLNQGVDIVTECVGAPCNPGPGGPPPKCNPRPRLV